MTSCIVTGCAGFIGSHLVEKLLDMGWEVTGIDNFHPYYPRKIKEQNLKKIIENKNFDFIEASILSDKDLLKLPKNVNYVFHYAAIAGVRNSIQHPEQYFEINLKGTSKLLNSIGTIDKFIFASSSSVYGDVNPNDFPVKEEHPLNPISPYGESKKQAEELCIKFSKEHNLKSSLLRFYTVYGPRQRPDEAITKFIRMAQSGMSIPIYGDGTKERDYTYVSDIVKGSIQAAKKGNGVYNLGTGKTITVNEMISLLENLLGHEIKKKFTSPQEGDVEKTHSSILKAKQELGYSPEMTFEKGLNECVRWCKETDDLKDLVQYTNS